MLYELAIRSDNRVLDLLRRTPSWKYIAQFASNNLFWFQRTEWLIGQNIGWTDWDDVDWKNVYYDFQFLDVKNDAQRQTGVFSVDFLSNPASVRLAIDLGYQPDDRNLVTAAGHGYDGTVAQLLALPYIEPRYNRSAALRAAAKGQTETVRLLLDDRRSDPTQQDSECLFVAADEGYADIVALLLKDGRADPADDDSYALQCAVEGGYADVVTLLLADGRADPLVDDGRLVRIAQGETLEVLLADPRVRAAGLG